MIRTIIYARVSTEDQAEKYGIPAQLRACRDYAASHDMEIVGELIDDGYTGATMDRPALERLRRQVAGGEAEAVLMLDVDRLSREMAHLLILKPELEKRACLEFVTAKFENSPSGRLFFGIRGVVGQYERELTLQRTLRGKKEKALAGLVVGAGRTAYGYRYQDGMLVEDPVKGNVVRRIFHACAEGKSIRAITRELRESGAPTWTGRRWGHSSVRRILANETYAGMAYYNSHRRDGAALLFRPREEWISIPVQGLVDRSLWEQAQTRLAGMFCGRPSNLLLSGLVYCGDCGRRMYAESNLRNRAYRCAGRDTLRHGGSICRNRAKASVWDELAWDTLASGFGDPNFLRRMLVEQQTAVRASEPDQTEDLKLRLERLRRKQDAALALMLDPEMMDSRTQIRAQYRAVTEERRKLEAEVARLERARRPAPALDWVEEMTALLKEDIESLDASGRQAFAKSVIQRADYRGDHLDMTCFIRPEMYTTCSGSGHFDALQLILTARLAA